MRRKIHQFQGYCQTWKIDTSVIPTCVRQTLLTIRPHNFLRTNFCVARYSVRDECRTLAGWTIKKLSLFWIREWVLESCLANIVYISECRLFDRLIKLYSWTIIYSFEPRGTLTIVARTNTAATLFLCISDGPLFLIATTYPLSTTIGSKRLLAVGWLIQNQARLSQKITFNPSNLSRRT